MTSHLAGFFDIVMGISVLFYQQALVVSYNRDCKMREENELSNLPNCLKCNSEYTYEDGSLLVCPECAYEWSLEEVTGDNPDEKIVKDSNGNVLNDGDTVSVIKDLKVKGTSSVIKIGTKVKGIRLVDGDHDIDCKIDGFGAMKLKSEFVKKI
jgi:protein PhnA